MYKKLVYVISAALLMASFATIVMAESIPAKANATPMSIQAKANATPMETAASIDMKPLTLPPLVWVTGTVHEILVQPGEQFYVFGVKPAQGSEVFLRIADAHTGTPMRSVTTGNLVYDLMKEAYFRNLNVQVGYRDFGLDPQSGINKLCIDRVILTQ